MQPAKQTPPPSAGSAGREVVLRSFDGTEAIRARLTEPLDREQLFASLKRSSKPIPRGAGLSYCAASMGNGVESISSSSLRTICDFDQQTGLMTVESGVTLGELLETAMAVGWYPPVLAGHPSITVGGSIAFNVHGKSQYNTGNFESCIERLWLFHPDHGEIECGAGRNLDILRLTVGGFGLSGFITRARLRMEKLKGRSMRVRRVACKDLIETVERMEELKSSSDSVYSWNDLNLRGQRFGRGFVYATDFEAQSLAEISRYEPLSPPERPLDRVGLWNRLTAPAMCRIYGLKESLSNEKRLGIRAGSFPVYGKEFYYRLFGSSGFHEYQLIVPKERWASYASELRGLLERSGLATSLGALKLFSGRPSLLNFSMSGVCLAINVPAGPKTRQLFGELDNLTARLGGIVNVSKDSRLSPATIERLFPGYSELKSELLKFDISKRFDSALRQRLAL